MIPTIELDRESFREIMEKARKRIPILFPEWTDFNESDPGITFLELFSWLKEMQEFHLNQIGSSHLRSYLKLLGIKPKGIHPAHAIVSCRTEREEVLPAGTCFAAGEIPFESVHPVRLYPGKLARMAAYREDGSLLWQREMPEQRQRLGLPVFGIGAEQGNVLALQFTEPFAWGEEYSFCITIKDDYPIKRNPAGEDFLPLAGIGVVLDTGEDYLPCQVTRDDTKAFVQSGIFSICTPQPEKDSHYPEAGGKTGSRLLIRLDWSEYDVAPVLDCLDLNPVELIQWYTVAEQGSGFSRGERILLYKKTENGYRPVPGEETEKPGQEYLWCRLAPEAGEGILGIGTGFPGQQFSLEIRGILADTVEVLAEHPEYPGCFERWKRVDDLSASGPEDRHFTVLEEQGSICFGDNYHGLAPEGEIRLLAAKQTEGLAGNVQKGQIHPVPQEGKRPFYQASNEENVLDGDRAETFEECLERFQAGMEEGCCAVTEKDYERMLYRTPGLMIEKAKVVETDFAENRICAAVKIWSEQPCPGLSRLCRENIVRYMDGSRLLGTDFQVLEPDYIHVNLYMDLELYAYYRDGKRTVEEKLREFFRQNQADFGKPVLYGTLYGLLDGMECVKRIVSLTIDARGPGIERNRSNDVILPPSGLTCLEQIQCSVSYSG